jgi:hypothetical protein
LGYILSEKFLSENLGWQFQGLEEISHLNLHFLAEKKMEMKNIVECR